MRPTGKGPIGIGGAAALVLAGALAAPGDAAEPRPGIDWPSFRGPRASGVAEGFPLPERWNVPEGARVLWTAPVPGLAHSSPVVWGDWIFVTTAIASEGEPELKVGLYGDVRSAEDDSEHRYEVLCLAKESGAVRWRRTAHQGVPEVRRHPKSTHANPTPATDGERVVSFFGSEGLYCHDLEGRLLWKKDFGVLDSGFFVAPGAQWGFASSPVIHEGKVVVQCDVQGDSFVAALDVETGRELWRTARDEVPTWSTPTVWESTDGEELVFLNGYQHIGAYRLATGEEVWRMHGGGDIPVPTPVVAHGLVYVTNAHGRMAPVYAIHPGARGDITLDEDETSNRGVAWSVARDGGYMQTPIVYRDLLYVGRDNGVVSVFDATSGELEGRRRLGEGATGFTSSPVAGDGKLYFTSEEGEVFVLRAGPELEELARNDLGEVHMATPAISEGVLYFRTRGHLVAIGGEAPRPRRADD